MRNLVSRGPAYEQTFLLHRGSSDTVKSVLEHQNDMSHLEVEPSGCRQHTTSYVPGPRSAFRVTWSEIRYLDLATMWSSGIDPAGRPSGFARQTKKIMEYSLSLQQRAEGQSFYNPQRKDMPHTCGASTVGPSEPLSTDPPTPITAHPLRGKGGGTQAPTYPLKNPLTADQRVFTPQRKNLVHGGFLKIG